MLLTMTDFEQLGQDFKKMLQAHTKLSDIIRTERVSKRQAVAEIIDISLVTIKKPYSAT